ncbi:MAG: hypothetical protein ACOY35_05200 [Bacillota bacterium]
MKGYLTIHFLNSGWCNATISEEKKLDYLEKVLRSYKARPLQDRECVYCRQPAQFLADRQHIPLLTGMTTIITSPGGVPGLPVCGYCLMVIQFYPLATLKCQGKPLFWWTPEPQLLRELTFEYYQELSRLIAGGSEKLANSSWPRTRLLEAAEKVLDRYGYDRPLADCIGVHLTNYGAGPDYHQYRIPKELLEFLVEIRFADQEVRESHEAIIKKAWEEDKKPAKKGSAIEEPKTGSQRNAYYEALVETFEDRNWQENISKIIHRFFVHTKPEEYADNNYELTAFFLEKVGGMEKQRLDIIKRIADQIALDLVIGNNEKKWINDLYFREYKPSRFTGYLIKAQKNLAEKGKVFTMEDVLTMLDIYSEYDTGAKDFWLVRDLFLIRLLEMVGKHKKEMLDEIKFEDVSETNNGGK